MATREEISRESYERITYAQVCPICEAALGQRCVGLPEQPMPMHWQRRERYLRKRDVMKSSARLA